MSSQQQQQQQQQCPPSSALGNKATIHTSGALRHYPTLSSHALTRRLALRHLSPCRPAAAPAGPGNAQVSRRDSCTFRRVMGSNIYLAPSLAPAGSGLPCGELINFLYRLLLR
ncbi:hypothetical protein E2C01_008461 [Portunus trituberculatus]|uniref:Uncharacterized protein n=1 Tax=Portunus trituberculatus TaxID=210409 RepID=A0A5B7D5F8_PORTR|nr:hypothetical protein [Portunus trituberculatus]